ncbi:lyase family protein [Segniliparus rugosus]|uniref:3-carboxy-cis,cis-muconate cycloisomerase n=1 Tax=Segniliparus rugosus (strain ATCC BAA-974 / DSM 45345 / CCUG 50838 / CIP 108380 / JCM 13579 / CDC 945) TaxID=679197 RepID=E5XS54_SEGRC|nr:lyase family protein [Segniliparus rugosus]EFV12839.2 3-carboxy-cis,cis-muconate cycloisomerase [Segniliparus rugosus ATCC BAA-974]
MAEQLDVGLLSPVRAGTAVEEATGDQAWLAAMLAAEAALVAAQADLGTVPQHVAETIAKAARAGGIDARTVALAARENANPVVALVAAFTAVVAEFDPMAADYVHRGSTSQDVFDTGAMLVAKRALELIREDIEDTLRHLEELAERHRDTPMAGRTLALQATPTTFGLKAAGWREILLQAASQIDELLEDGLPVSLGGAAGTMAGYLEYARIDGGHEIGQEELVAAFARRTGLAPARLPWHSLRGPIARIGQTLAFTAGALGKIAVDVLVLVRSEIGEVAEPSKEGRGASSAMPHKRNPVLATMIRSAALQLPALASVLQQALLSEDERAGGVWQSEWSALRDCLRLAGGAAATAAELARGLVVDESRMRRNLELGGAQLATERLAARLAPSLGKARAKTFVTKLSGEAAATGTPLVLLAAERCDLEYTEVAALLDPTTYLGAASDLVVRAIS